MPRFTYPIAIDMAHQNIYAAQLLENRQGLAVRGLAHRHIEEETGEESAAGDVLVSAFKEIRRNRRFSGRRVVMHLPPDSIFRFPIHFQIGEAETLEETILRESEGHLPFPMEEAIIDYPSLVSPASSGDNQHKAMVIAVHRDRINQYQNLLRQAGLTLEAVDFGLSSLIRLHQVLCQTSQNPILLCNIGEKESLLAAITENSILAQRNISWGVQVLLKKIQASFELNKEPRKAENLLSQYGLLYADNKSTKKENDPAQDGTAEEICRAVYQIVSPHLEELIHEFHKIISYVRSQERNAPLDGIYLYGQASLIHNLDSYLERRFNIPIHLINPMSKMGLSDNHILPEPSQGALFTLALGLAMRRLSWL